MSDNPLAALPSSGSGLFASTATASKVESKVSTTTRPGRPGIRSPKPPKPNQWAGACLKCGGQVAAGAGTIAKDSNEKWKPIHLPGECVEKQGTLPGIGADPQPVPGQRGGRFQSPGKVHPGIYTVEGPRGHRTFRVWLQQADADFAPGELLLEVLVGPDNSSDYKSIAFLGNGSSARFFKKFREAGNQDIIAAAEQLLSNPEAALKAKHCLRCNAVLSHPDSIVAGLGPECIKKGW